MSNSIKLRNSAKPSSTQSAVDRLVQQIKDYIRSNALSVGDSLPSEREVGEKFSAARNTVREAFRILKTYGVVEIKPKIGAVIVNRHLPAALDLFSFQLAISPESFQDIQGFRRLIEVGSVDRLFKYVTDADIQKLYDINLALLNASGAKEGAEQDFIFHVSMLAISRNNTVVDVFSMMKPMVSRLMETGKEQDGLQKTYEHHQQIIDALAARDRLAFTYFMSAHLDQGMKYVRDSIESKASR